MIKKQKQKQTEIWIGGPSRVSMIESQSGVVTTIRVAGVRGAVVRISTIVESVHGCYLHVRLWLGIKLCAYPHTFQSNILLVRKRLIILL